MSYIPSAAVATNPILFPCLLSADAVSPRSRGTAYVSCSTHTPKLKERNALDRSGKDVGGRYTHSSGAWSGWQYHRGVDFRSPSRRQAPSLDTSLSMETPNTSILDDSLSRASTSFIPPSPAPASPGPSPEGTPSSSSSSGVLSQSDLVTSSIISGNTGGPPMQSSTTLGATSGPTPSTPSAPSRTSVSQPEVSSLASSQPPVSSSGISIISRETPQPNSILSTAEEPVTTSSIFTTAFLSMSISATISETMGTPTDIPGSLSTTLSEMSLSITPTLNSTSTEHTSSLSDASSTASETSTPVPFTSTTSLDEPSTSLTIDPIPESNTPSTSETIVPTITTTSWFASLPTSRIPTMTPNTIPPSTPLTYTSQPLSTSTYTKYWTTTRSRSPTVTSSTPVQTGVLSTDRTRSDGGFEHNKGAIIGIAIAGTFTLILSVVVVFFACRRYKRREGVVSDSRENFLGHAADPAWRSPLEGDDEFDPFHRYRSLPAAAYPHLNDGGGDGEVNGDNEGGGGGSTESAEMYPVQTHPFGGGMDPNTPTPGFGRSVTDSALPSQPIPGPALARMGSGRERARSLDGMVMGSGEPVLEWSSGSIGVLGSSQAQFFPHKYPYQIANTLDPFHDRHEVSPEINPGSMSGHQSSGGNSKSTSSLYLGSSSQGHAIGNTYGGISRPTSSSGHGAASARSKSVSPAGKTGVPPSSFVPPRGGTESDSGSGSDRPSVRGLLGMLKGKGKSKEKRGSTQLERATGARSSAESMVSQSLSVSQSQHGTMLGHASLHGHGPPSSLLNPPMPILVLPPQNEFPPPESIPTIRYSDISQPPPGVGYAYSTPEELVYSGYYPQSRTSLGLSAPHDLWPPPVFPSSPSPVPTDASSMVEGLLNPRMLPGGIGGEQRRSGVLGLGSFEAGGGSVMSLRDNVDYSRPISGAAFKMKSTTTFGTVGIEGEGAGSLSASTSIGPEMVEIQDRGRD